MDSKLTFFRTNTRFFGIFMPEGTTITIEHASRTEAVDASGMILGGDITKDGTPVDVPEKACIRRIEAPAILGAGWKVDTEAEQECNSLTRLAEDMDGLVKNCGNDTYKAAWLAYGGRNRIGRDSGTTPMQPPRTLTSPPPFALQCPRPGRARQG
jgi:hypothetical protein